MASKTRKKAGPGGARPGAGRKAEVSGLRKVLVSLDPASIAEARRLGDGNVSAGVREALRLATGDAPAGNATDKGA